jgi:type IV pilus assembly protein PilN
MIRVNLISVTPGQSPAREWLPKEQRSAAVGLVLLLATAIGITSWWWYLSHESRKVERSITVAEQDLARLKDVAQLVERATARKGELADRLDLIERLRATMRAPVRLFETVSRSVPHGLWLLEIKQVGSSIQVDGRAMSLTPVTDFAKQMQESGFFQMPVEIVSTTSEILEEVPVIRFMFKADLASAGTPAAAKAKPVATEAPVPAPTVATPSPTSPLNAEAAGYQPPPAAPKADATQAGPAKAATPVGPPKTEIAPARSSGGR